ncbi:MAG: DUF177 domain-containing protein [Bacilli bacterium]|nr:DUF177 domain-containing protein [Bacilli bacterium]
MKYYINQLIKEGTEPFEINETVDFSEVAQTHREIRRISPVKITGTGKLSGTEVIFDLHISCDVVLPCALTLDDVNYHMEIDTIEYFTFKEDAKEEDYDFDMNIVKGPVIELAPVIWQNIVVNIPLRVVSEHAYEKIKKEGADYKIFTEEEFEKEKSIDPRFAILKDLLNK